MPTPVIKSFAKRSGKTVQDVEAIWNRVKASTTGTEHEEDYEYITGAVKNSLGLDETVSFSEFFQISKGKKD